MKFAFPMLLEFVETSLTAVQVGDLLTMAGFELEGIEVVEGDPVLDIKVVSNRGDGLSVFGLAREVLAKDRAAKPTELYRQAQRRFPMQDEGSAEVATKIKVSIETRDCHRYACRVFAGAPNLDAPEWLQKRIRQAGMRPISLLVDLTNYVMLEIGQPMHAFDLDKLQDKAIVVRSARQGEKLKTLNGQDHELNPAQMMICDVARPVGAAGVMGGADTEISAATRTVLLESANFRNTAVRRTRKQMNLSTDASYRFERSVDPELAVAGLNRFAMLLEQISGVKCAVPGVLDEYPGRADHGILSVRMSRTRKLLGMEVSAEEAKTILDCLGFEVQGSGEPFSVTIPTWRPDIVREDDLVEEIGRVHGYDKVPDCMPHGATTQGGVFGRSAMVDLLREALVRVGFVQTMSHDLRDRHPLDSPNLEPIGPRNPHSPETAWLRTSLLPSLADAAKRNGAKDIHIFEIGSAFGRGRSGPFCGGRLAMVSIGRLHPQESVRPSNEVADYYSMKAAVIECLNSIGLSPSFVATDLDPRFHPTRTAGIMVGDVRLGFVGQIHPDAAEACGLPDTTQMVSIDLDRVEPAGKRFGFKQLSRNPSVRRDIAFLIAKSVPYAQIESAVAAACGTDLERQWLFDVYEGQNVPEGCHSLTVALQLRRIGENLTDEEANRVREKAVAALGSLGATMR